MSKYLIPTFNTSWGVEVSVMGPNKIKHAISFPGDNPIERRDIFIADQLFGDKNYNWKEDKNWIETKLLRTSSKQAFVSVSNNKRNRELDNIIINEYDEYLFYSVAEREIINSAEIILTLDLDIFITYPIQSIIKEWSREDEGDTFNIIRTSALKRYSNIGFKTVEPMYKSDYFSLDINRDVNVKTFDNLRESWEFDLPYWILGWKRIDESTAGTHINGVPQRFLITLAPLLSSNTTIREFNTKDRVIPTFINSADNTDSIIIPFVPEFIKKNATITQTILESGPVENDYSIKLDFPGVEWTYPFWTITYIADEDLTSEINLYNDKFFDNTIDWYSEILTESKVMINGKIVGGYQRGQVLKDGTKRKLKITINPYPFNDSVIYYENQQGIINGMGFNLSIQTTKNDYDQFRLQHNSNKFYQNFHKEMSSTKVWGDNDVKNMLASPISFVQTSDDSFTMRLFGGIKIVSPEIFDKQNTIQRNQGLAFNEFQNLKIYSHEAYDYYQIDDMFNLVDKELSPEIKQDFSTYFSNGITFWHYTDDYQGLLVWKQINKMIEDNNE